MKKFFLLILILSCYTPTINSQIAIGADLALTQGIGISYTNSIGNKETTQTFYDIANKETTESLYQAFYDIGLKAIVADQYIALQTSFTVYSPNSPQLRLTAELLFPYVTIGKHDKNPLSYFELSPSYGFFKAFALKNKAFPESDLFVGFNIGYNKHVKDRGDFMLQARVKRMALASSGYPTVWTLDFGMYYRMDVTRYKK